MQLSTLMLSLQKSLKIVALATGLFSYSAYAQLPELANASAASGQSTSARFFAGSSADNGASFANTFNPSQALDVKGEIGVEDDHVGTTGDLFLVIMLGEQIFMRAADQSYQLWDGSLENLQATQSGKILGTTEPIVVVEDTPFSSLGLNDAVLTIYFAYSTQAVPGELYYSGSPLSLTINSTLPTMATSQTLFNDTISAPIIQSRCIVCHVAGGSAQATPLVYARGTTANFRQLNYDTILNYLRGTANAASLIRTKPQGQVSHFGGTQIAPGSSLAQAWEAFVSAAITDINAQ